MLKAKEVFSGISVDDVDTAKDFYTTVLGLTIDSADMGLHFKLPNGGTLFIYGKSGHTPATFTVLNFVVDDIDEAVDELTQSGVHFEHYTDMPMQPDDKGVLRGLSAGKGPDIAWFKDPAGNIISILQDK
jgi:predicted enzyme related to lactoylglutathione lyase